MENADENRSGEDDVGHESEETGQNGTGGLQKFDADNSARKNSDKKSKNHSNTQDTVQNPKKSSKTNNDDKPYGVRAERKGSGEKKDAPSSPEQKPFPGTNRSSTPENEDEEPPVTSSGITACFNEKDLLPHDFSLECQFIVQTMTFVGFYQTFASALLYLICIIGLALQLLVFEKIRKYFYTKTLLLNIKSITMILKYGFVFFALGNALSVQNYSFIKKIIEGDQIDEVNEEVSFDQVLSFG